MIRGSYMLLEPGMTVRSSNGEDLGTIADVVADENLDIFRGIVLDTGGLHERDLFVPGDQVVAVDGDVATLALDRAALSKLGTVESISAG